MTASSPQAEIDAPIGIFDSGVGGLTVLKAVRTSLPHENLVYLGDTARVPYGTKSAETVVRYAQACARKLHDVAVKHLVIACNTVSAVALPALQRMSDLPVLGVIEPGASAGVQATRSGRIGVISTIATVQSEAYPRAIQVRMPTAQVWSQAAPLLVPLVEEGWVQGPVPELALQRYLEPLLQHDIDTLILGCTHYPVLKPTLLDVVARMGRADLRVVDSADAVAGELKGQLQSARRVNPQLEQGSIRLLVTDMPAQFHTVAARFLDDEYASASVTVVDL